MKIWHVVAALCRKNYWVKCLQNWKKYAQRLCLLHETHFKRMYAKKIMQKLKNTTKMVKSTYKFERIFFRTGRRIAPKFGTHVPIDTLTLIG